MRWLSEIYRSFNATKKQRNYVIKDMRRSSIIHNSALLLAAAVILY